MAPLLRQLSPDVLGRLQTFSAVPSEGNGDSPSSAADRNDAMLPRGLTMPGIANTFQPTTSHRHCAAQVLLRHPFL